MREKKAKLSFEVQYRYLQIKLHAKWFEKLKKMCVCVCSRTQNYLRAQTRPISRSRAKVALNEGRCVA